MTLLIYCVSLVFVVIAWIVQYLLKNRRYYYLAMKFPKMNSYLPNWAVAFILSPFYKLDFYQFMRRAAGSSNADGFYGAWLPKFTVVVKKPEYLQTVFSSPHVLDKSFHYDGLSKIAGPTGLVSCGGEVFRKSKRIFLKSFNASSQEIILENIFLEGDILMNNLQDLVGKGFFKFAPIIRRTTTNGVMGGALGIKLEKDNALFTQIDNIETIMMLSILSATVGKIPFISRLFTNKLDEYRSDVLNICKDIYRKKLNDFSEMIKNNEEVPNQYIYSVMRERKEDPIEEVYADIVTSVVAGLNPSAVNIASALVLLGMYPDIQDKVYEEDRRIQEEVKGRKIVEDDFSKYEYLRRVIKETLRLYPTVPMFARHVGEEIKFGDLTLPKDSSIVVFIPYIHRDPENFPSPNKFDPDRFLPENFEKFKPFSYLPFSHGQRQCPGIRYAKYNAIYFISSIIRKFKVFSKYGTVEEMDNNVSGFITLVDKEEFTIRLEARH